MDSSKLAVKFFAADGPRPKSRDFLPVFHQWIQTHALDKHLLIDVADYDHVANGPGAVLVSHEANLSTDLDGGLGLLYIRKTALEGDLPARLRQMLRFALSACRKLEETPSLGGLRFRTDNPLIQINDRLHAPNTPETFAAVQPALEAAFKDLYGGPVVLQRNPDSEALFEIRVTAPSSPAVAAMLDRLDPW